MLKNYKGMSNSNRPFDGCEAVGCKIKLPKQTLRHMGKGRKVEGSFSPIEEEEERRMWKNNYTMKGRKGGKRS